MKFFLPNRLQQQNITFQISHPNYAHTVKQDQTTIKDIARELGVSISTVSRALADSPLVKSQTKEAVKALAKSKNYHPNFTALSLRNRSTKTIGLLVPFVVHDFFSKIIQGIEDEAFKRGYNVIICASNDSAEREKQSALDLLNGRIDGLILSITKETTDFNHLEEFRRRNVPLVLFDCVTDQIEAEKVIVDDHDAGFRATEHLIEQGCKKIAFVGGPSNLLTNQARYKGYLDALSKNKIPFEERFILHCSSPEFEDGLSISAQLFNEKGQYPDGVFATTDFLAIGAMKNAKKAGLRIPKDVAFIGFSNWEVSKIYEPTLSTVDQKGYEIGQKVIMKLLRQIESDEPTAFETETIVTDLIVRESSLKKGV